MQTKDDRIFAKANHLTGVLAPTLNRQMTHADVEEWAMALALQAGCVLALLAQQQTQNKIVMPSQIKDATRYVERGVKFILD